MLTKKQAHEIHGGMTQTTKMPAKSYSLPTIACVTGFRMSAIAGSICSMCYAARGNYHRYQATTEPVQHARLESINDPLWIDAIVTSIGKDKYFRWHDSGDIQSVEHLEKIAEVCKLTPDCKHWLPTREYGMVAAFCASNDVPDNLVIRLSAMFIDKPVKIPASLQGVNGITASNVHSMSNEDIRLITILNKNKRDSSPFSYKGLPVGEVCKAPSQGGKCADCRACWNSKKVVSYHVH